MSPYGGPPAPDDWHESRRSADHTFGGTASELDVNAITKSGVVARPDTRIASHGHADDVSPAWTTQQIIAGEDDSVKDRST